MESVEDKQILQIPKSEDGSVNKLLSDGPPDKHNNQQNIMINHGIKMEKIHKCHTTVNANVLSTDKPIYVLQKQMSKHGLMKPALIVLQPIKKAVQNVDDKVTNASIKIVHDDRIESDVTSDINKPHVMKNVVPTTRLKSKPPNIISVQSKVVKIPHPIPNVVKGSTGIHMESIKSDNPLQKVGESGKNFIILNPIKQNQNTAAAKTLTSDPKDCLMDKNEDGVKTMIAHKTDVKEQKAVTFDLKQPKIHADRYNNKAVNMMPLDGKIKPILKQIPNIFIPKTRLRQIQTEEGINVPTKTGTSGNCAKVNKDKAVGKFDKSEIDTNAIREYNSNNDNIKVTQETILVEDSESSQISIDDDESDYDDNTIESQDWKNDASTNLEHSEQDNLRLKAKSNIADFDNSKEDMETLIEEAIIMKSIQGSPDATANKPTIVRTYMKKPSHVSSGQCPPRLPPSPEPTSNPGPLPSSAPSKNWPRLALSPIGHISSSDQPVASPARLLTTVATSPLESPTTPPTPQPDVLRIQTKTTNPKTSQDSVPIFIGPVNRWFMLPADFTKLIDNIKKKHIEQNKDTTNPHVNYKVENEKMCDIVKWHLNENNKLKAELRELKKVDRKRNIQMSRLEAKLKSARPKMTMTRSRAFNIVTKNMTEDAKMVLRMQMEQKKKKAKGRRFNLKEKLFSLALYKLSKPAYDYLSNILTMPNVVTVEKFWRALHKQLLIKEGKMQAEKTDGDSIENDDEIAAALESIHSENKIGPDDNPNDHSVNSQTLNETTYLQIENSANMEDYTIGEPYNGNEIIITTENDGIEHYQNLKDTTICDNEAIYLDIQEQGAVPEQAQYITSEKSTSTIANVKLVTNSISKERTSKIKGSYMTNDKKQKIDYILSKMMSPDDLKKLIPRKKNKKKKKPQQKVTMENTVSDIRTDGIAGIQKRTPNVIRSRIVNPQTKIIVPKMSPKPQANKDFTDNCQSPERTSCSTAVICNVKNMPRIKKIIKVKSKSNVLPIKQELSTSNSPMYVLGTEDLRITQNETNVYNVSSDDAHTNTNLKHEYSDNTTQILQPERNITNDRIVSVKRKTILQESPVELKRNRHLTVDGSCIVEDLPRTSFRAAMYLEDGNLNEQDNLALPVQGTRNVKMLRRESVINQCEVNQEGSEGFNMQELEQDSSSVDSDRKKFGSKRLPSKLYRTGYYETHD